MGKRRRLRKQLNKLREKNTRWVERADAKEKNATVDDKTHYMSMSGVGKKDDPTYLVYPNVREKVDKYGVLKETNEDESFKAARDNKDALVFKDEEEALWASEVGYKQETGFPRKTVRDAKRSYRKGKRERKRATPKYPMGSGAITLGADLPPEARGNATPTTGLGGLSLGGAKSGGGGSLSATWVPRMKKGGVVEVKPSRDVMTAKERDKLARSNHLKNKDKLALSSHLKDRDKKAKKDHDLSKIPKMRAGTQGFMPRREDMRPNRSIGMGIRKNKAAEVSGQVLGIAGALGSVYSSYKGAKTQAATSPAATSPAVTSPQVAPKKMGTPHATAEGRANPYMRHGEKVGEPTVAPTTPTTYKPRPTSKRNMGFAKQPPIVDNTLTPDVSQAEWDAQSNYRDPLGGKGGSAEFLNDENYDETDLRPNSPNNFEGETYSREYYDYITSGQASPEEIQEFNLMKESPFINDNNAVSRQVGSGVTPGFRNGTRGVRLRRRPKAQEAFYASTGPKRRRKARKPA